MKQTICYEGKDCVLVSNVFGEFANILFLKLISESEQIKRESGIKTLFDATACSWDSIKNIPFTTRIDYINKTVYEKLRACLNFPV